MRVVVTGANGFIGQHTCNALIAHGHEVVQCVRSITPEMPEGCVAVGDLTTFDGWESILREGDAVIHLAARVHQVQETSKDPSAAFHAANVTVTERLLRACEKASVSRFIFASTIAVMGYHSGSEAFSVTSLNPFNPYSLSKAQAEALVAQSATNWSIIRIPLVYGEGVRANFYSLMKLIYKRLPLPFAWVKNQRSILYVGNLADAFAHTLGNSKAIGQILLIADPHVISSPELIRQIAKALGRKPRLLPVPPIAMRLATAALRRPMLYHKLCGNLEMDTAPTLELLDWIPPYTTQEGLIHTAVWFRAQRAKRKKL